MNFIQSINEFINVILLSLKNINRWKVWGALSIILIVHFILLLIHYKFYSPMFFGLISTWTQIDPKLAEGFMHYPGHFLLMPFYFEWSKLIVGIFYEGWILGTAAYVYYRISRPGVEMIQGSKLKLFLNLSVGWVIINGLVLLVNFYVPSLFTDFVHNAPRRQMALNYLFMPGLYCIVLAAFYYTLPVIAIYRVNVLKAIWFSFKMFASRPFFTYFIVVVVMTIPIIVSFALNNQQVIVQKFNPELIVWVMALSIFTEFIGNFFWIATSLNVLLEKE